MAVLPEDQQGDLNAELRKKPPIANDIVCFVYKHIVSILALYTYIITERGL